jgi:lipopolysaccharide export system permease protein
LKRLDYLIVKEISGPWLFGVALFGSLLFAGSYLNKVTEYIANGVPASLIGQFSFLLLPAILVQTFAMSTLLASLLSFGRLSSDSELVAIRASGVSLFRIIAPVSVFSLLVATLAFAVNETIVPAAAKRSVLLLDQLANRPGDNNYKDTSYPIKKDGKLQGMMVAREFVPGEGILRGVTVVGYKESGEPSAYLYAAELEFDSSVIRQGQEEWNGGGWRIRGKAEIVKADGSNVIKLNGGAWPPDFPKLTVSIQDLLKKNLKSFEMLSMRELRELIEENERAKEIPGAQILKPKEVRNYQYGYWNKIALPLAAFIFGTLGAALGIRNHRTGTAAGFALAVGIIFAYFTIANFMNVWALSGLIPPYVASFSPIAIGFIASIVIIWRRNA